MRDGDIREALRTALADEHRDELDDTLIVDELGLCGQVRVDVALLNGALSGYELKSTNDTLRRLPTQVEFYSRVLDYATLVVATKHRERAAALIPDWWGCITAHWVEGHVELEPVTAAILNPKPDPTSIALLLWRDEALDELEARDLARGRRSWTRGRLCEALAKELPVDELRHTVRERLKGREDWRPAR